MFDIVPFNKFSQTYYFLGCLKPEDCPSGTFNNNTAQKSEGDCEKCTPGYYCETSKLDKPTGPCDPK